MNGLLVTGSPFYFTLVIHLQLRTFPSPQDISTGLATLGSSYKNSDSKFVDCIQYQRVRILYQRQHLVFSRSSLAARDNFGPVKACSAPVFVKAASQCDLATLV